MSIPCLLTAVLQEGETTDLTITQRLENLAFTYGPKVIAAAVILVIGWLLAKLATSIIRRAMMRSKVEPTLAGFVANITHAALLAFVVVAAISKIGVETASFVAILGAAGFAIGFAMQGSLSSFAAGVMIMIFRPFKAGDLIDAGGQLGKVQEVGIFATIMNTLDNRRVIISNSTITGGNIINYTANDTRRVDMTLGIGYGDEIPKAMKVLQEICEAHELVLAEPKPTVAVSGLGDSSVNFAVRPWCHPDNYWTVYFDIHKTVKMTFDEQDITIPFPQRDVHMHSVA